MSEQAALETAITATATKTTLAGGGVSVIGLLTSIDWLSFIGVMVAILGLLINIYFQIRKDRREDRESNARIEAITRKGEDDAE